MKDVTKSNWGSGAYLLSLNMWNEDQERRHLPSICISWEMICQVKLGWKIFYSEL